MVARAALRGRVSTLYRHLYRKHVVQRLLAELGGIDQAEEELPPERSTRVTMPRRPRSTDDVGVSSPCPGRADQAAPPPVPGDGYGVRHQAAGQCARHRLQLTPHRCSSRPRIAVLAGAVAVVGVCGNPGRGTRPAPAVDATRTGRREGQYPVRVGHHWGPRRSVDSPSRW